MRCTDCKFANKSGNEEFVFCTYWQGEANKYSEGAEGFVRNVIFQLPFPRKVGLGWGYPNKLFNAETHWSVKGTASEGLMWRDQICINKDDRCHKYEGLIYQ